MVSTRASGRQLSPLWSRALSMGIYAAKSAVLLAAQLHHRETGQNRHSPRSSGPSAN
jgi:hypothetical protein